MNWGEKRENIGIEETKEDMAFGSQSMIWILWTKNPISSKWFISRSLACHGRHIWSHSYLFLICIKSPTPLGPSLPSITLALRIKGKCSISLIFKRSGALFVNIEIKQITFSVPDYLSQKFISHLLRKIYKWMREKNSFKCTC